MTNKERDQEGQEVNLSELLSKVGLQGSDLTDALDTDKIDLSAISSKGELEKVLDQVPYGEDAKERIRNSYDLLKNEENK